MGLLRPFSGLRRTRHCTRGSGSRRSRRSRGPHPRSIAFRSPRRSRAAPARWEQVQLLGGAVDHLLPQIVLDPRRCDLPSGRWRVADRLRRHPLRRAQPRCAAGSLGCVIGFLAASTRSSPWISRSATRRPSLTIQRFTLRRRTSPYSARTVTATSPRSRQPRQPARLPSPAPASRQGACLSRVGQPAWCSISAA